MAALPSCSEIEVFAQVNGHAVEMQVRMFLVLVLDHRDRSPYFAPEPASTACSLNRSQCRPSLGSSGRQRASQVHSAQLPPTHVLRPFRPCLRHLNGLIGVQPWMIVSGIGFLHGRSSPAHALSLFANIVDAVLFFR